MFNFDWQSVVGHNQPKFPGISSLSGVIKALAEDESRTPIIALVEKSDIAFREFRDDEYFVVVICYDRYKLASSRSTECGYFFIDVLRSILKNEDDLVSKQFLTALESELENGKADLQVIKNAVGVRTLASLAKSMTRAALLGENIEGIHEIAEVFSDDAGQLILDVAEHRARSAAVKEFESQIDADKWSEKQWQKFFYCNSWILGNVHDLYFFDVDTMEVFVRSADPLGKGARKVDFFGGTVGELSFARLVEIKLPSTELLAKKEYRNGVYAPSSPLSGACQQVVTYCRDWATNQQNERLKRLAVFPQGVLVVGNTSQLRGNPDLPLAFENYRTALHGVSIVCYDELLDRAKKMVFSSTSGETLMDPG